MSLTKVRLTLLLMFLVFLVSCVNGKKVKCDKDFPAPQRHSATGWNLDAPAGQGYELLGPRESGGTITMGNNLSVENNQDGDKNSQAVTTFNCGTDKSCVISYSTGGSGTWGAGEKFKVEFTDADGKKHHRTLSQHTAGTHPATIVLPTCGKISIKVTMDEGTQPGIQANATIGPFKYYCSKCKS